MIFPRPPDQPFSSLPCPRCRESLVVHMPDPELPERLLGTCGECKSWLLIDETGVMVPLPVEELLRREQRPDDQTRRGTMPRVAV